MKFVRKSTSLNASKTRERVIDILAKSMLIAFSALVCLWMISGARASGAEITDIQQSQLADGSYAVDFLFSKPVTKDEVSVDYQRNFIQLTLKGISAYPARTTKLNHAAMEKVFTYQYQPDVTRARMLLKAQASAIQPYSSLDVGGDRVRILVKSGALAAVSTQAAVDAVKQRNAAPALEAAVDPEEAKLRREIAAGQGNAAAVVAAATTATAAPSATSAPAAPIAAKPEKPVDKESLPLFSRTEGSAVKETKEAAGSGPRVITSLLLVLGLIAAGSLGFRRFAKGKGFPLQFQRQAKLMEVISSTSMGPKRSIAIVKVLDQYMVVGNSEGGMTMLKDLGSNVSLDRHVEETSVSPGFANTFQGVLSGAAGASVADSAAVAGPGTKAAEAGIRSSIKKRLEGFKPL